MSKNSHVFRPISPLFDLFHPYFHRCEVNTKERIVGWYSTGPKIKPSDLSIHELYRRYCPEPVLVVMDVQPKDLELPMEAYYSVQEQTSDEAHLPTECTVDTVTIFTRI